MKTLFLCTLMAAFLFFTPNANFGQAPNLGSTSSFAFFTKAGSFNNDGITVIKGDIGSYSSSPVGFPPGIVNGNIYPVGDPALISPFFDVSTAFSNFTTGGLPLATPLELNNGTGFIYPGTYSTTGAAALNGNFTLDAQGNPNAIFVININGALRVAAGSTITLLNGASLCNVYWQIDGAFALGAGAAFQGTVIASGAIALLEGASLMGRALTTAGAIELHNNFVTIPMTPLAPTVNLTQPTCALATGTITATAPGSPVYTVTGASPSVLAVSNETGVFAGLSAGVYNVTVNSATECVSPATSVTILEQPLTTSMPTVSLVQPTCEVAGSASITNYNADYSYTFSPSGPTVGAGGVITGFTIGQAYTVKATNAALCQSAASAPFTIQNALDAPVHPLVSVVAATCVAAGSASISNYSSGYTYTFSPSGPTTGAGGVITGFTIGQAYTVKATNAALCQSAASAIFTIQNALDAPVQPLVSVVEPTCVAAGSATISNYSSGYTYTFSPSGPTLGAGGVITGFTIGQAYTVKATNAALCVSAASAPFTIEAFENPKCLIEGEVSVCPMEDGLIYSGPKGMTSYDWSIIGDASIVGATDGQSVTVNVGTICGGSAYTVYLNVTDENVCISSCELTVKIKIPVFILPEDVIKTVACVKEAVEPIPPVVIDNCGRTVEGVLCNPPVTKLKWAIICERTVIYTFCYTACDGSINYWTYTYNIVYEDMEMLAGGYETISGSDKLYTPTPPPIYDNCGHLLKTEGPTASPIPDCKGTVTYTWAYLDCNRKIVFWRYTFTILGNNCSDKTTLSIGNTEVYTGTSTAANRRAMPVTFNEKGEIQSISIYHNGGTGNVLLGVYSDQPGLPSTQLGVTAATVINPTAGWQTVSLTSPVTVTSGQKVWLAWVFQNNPGVRYTAGTPSRAQSTATWAGGMPTTFSASTIAGNKFSIYCTYTPGYIPTIAKLGNTDVFSGTSTAANRRAMPVTFSETGEIQSISVYHNGGTGNVLLGVYSDQPGLPSTQLGVTASTVINAAAGWQTVSLTSPVAVTSGQKVWLAWVFQNNPGVRYMAGTPGRAQSTATWSGGMPATFGSSTTAGNKFSIYCTYTPGYLPTIAKLGNTDIYGGTSTAANRRAMPVTFSDAGKIQSISIYHNGGVGNVLLGVYSDQPGLPSTQLGVTASTVINAAAGWQTISLTSPVTVTSGQKVWLAWVFQNNPGVRYTAGTPGRAQSTATWAGGMPATFGASTTAGNKFSIYCTYIVDLTKSAEMATAIKPAFEDSYLKAYPNPFTEKLNIEFRSTIDSRAKLEIYNIAGARMETLYDGQVNQGELYTVEYLPRLISSQVVLYHLTINGKTQVGKLIYNERR